MVHCILPIWTGSCFKYNVYDFIKFPITGGSPEPKVTSLESLQACCEFLWSSAGLFFLFCFAFWFVIFFVFLFFFFQLHCKCRVCNKFQMEEIQLG